MGGVGQTEGEGLKGELVAAGGDGDCDVQGEGVCGAAGLLGDFLGG